MSSMDEYNEKDDQEAIESVLKQWQESEQYQAVSPLERPLRQEITRKSHYIQIIITGFVLVLIVINFAVLLQSKLIIFYVLIITIFKKTFIIIIIYIYIMSKSRCGLATLTMTGS